MKPAEQDREMESWTPDSCTSEDWTGEQDMVAAIALVVSLAIAALIFVLLAAIELSP